MKSEPCDICCKDFWDVDIANHQFDHDLCQGALSDEEEKSIPEEETFVQNKLIRKRSKQCFLRSKRREKSFWRSKRRRRAAALAEMRMRAAESLEELPLWRRGEMAMRVFIAVARIIKIRIPARGSDYHVPMQVTSQLHTIIICGQHPSDNLAVAEAYLGPQAPPWSQEEDEDEADDVDLSRNPSMCCTFCQDEVLLPFGICKQCPKCKTYLA